MMAPGEKKKLTRISESLHEETEEGQASQLDNEYALGFGPNIQKNISEQVIE